MTKTVNYFIVDVFAEQKYAGNQLAVFIDLEKSLSSEQMLAMTREINFAESVFIRSCESNNTFEVRIFTTEYEVPFAGHPCLGSAYVIAKYLISGPERVLALRTKKGVVPISINGGECLDQCRFTMRQAQPVFGASFSAKEVADGIGISLNCIDTKMVLQEVDTGLPYLLIFLKDLETIRELNLSAPKALHFLMENQMHKSTSTTGLTTSFFFVTAETTRAQNDYHTRMFAFENGTLWEDAATGSANGCLLAYLLKYYGRQQSVIVEQGFEMNRKSIIYLEGTVTNKEYNINVGGQVVPISEGTWFAD